jgi:hypothetical protein
MNTCPQSLPLTTYSSRGPIKATPLTVCALRWPLNTCSTGDPRGPPPPCRSSPLEALSSEQSGGSDAPSLSHAPPCPSAGISSSAEVVE